MPWTRVMLGVAAVIALGGCTRSSSSAASAVSPTAFAGSSAATGRGEKAGWDESSSPTTAEAVTTVGSADSSHPAAEEATPAATDLITTSEPDVLPGATLKPGVIPSLDELLLFYPVHLNADQHLDPPAGAESIGLTAKDGTRINAWWWPHSHPTAHLLYLHGNSGNLWTCARYFTWLHDAAGCAVLAVDYRGYGYSEGTPTVDGVLQDSRAARAWLREQMGDAAGREVIIGRSLGGALAVDLSAEQAPRGLVLESTFSCFKDAARHHAGAWAEIVPDGRLNSKVKLAEYPGPLLQVHGDADRIVPFNQGVALHEIATGPKQFICIPGGGHNNALTTTYLEALRTFLRELP